MDAATQQTVNLVLDFLLIAASIWMIIAVRGVGGVVGRTLNWIVVGAIILGAAHLINDIDGALVGPYNALVHRVIVLVGFVVLIYGFRQIRVLTR